MVIKMWCSHGEYYWQPECGSIKECVEWCIPYHHMPAYKGKCSSIFACIASLCLKASSSRRSDGQRISVDRFLSNSEARFLSGSLYCSWHRCSWWPLELILIVSLLLGTHFTITRVTKAIVITIAASHSSEL